MRLRAVARLLVRARVLHVCPPVQRRPAVLDVLLVRRAAVPEAGPSLSARPPRRMHEASGAASGPWGGAGPGRRDRSGGGAARVVGQRRGLRGCCEPGAIFAEMRRGRRRLPRARGASARHAGRPGAGRGAGRGGGRVGAGQGGARACGAAPGGAAETGTHVISSTLSSSAVPAAAPAAGAAPATGESRGEAACSTDVWGGAAPAARAGAAPALGLGFAAAGAGDAYTACTWAARRS